MDCPRCSAPLDTLKLRRNLELDWCPACAGTWYDGGELEAALGVDGGFAVAEEGRAQKAGVQCPRCSDACTELTWPAEGLVRIDHCGSCGGNWLDKGELEAIAKILEERKLPAAANIVETRALDGTMIRVLAAPLKKQTRWGWVATGAVVMVILFGLGLGFARFGEMFSAFSSSKVEDHSGHELWLASIPAFLLGGIFVGRGSSDFALKESALAALPAVAVVCVTAHGRLDSIATVGLIAVGMAVALVGGIIGERLQVS